jgi:tRNA threonylcarbamoyladenosine biosynthesis protein TsaE
MNKLVLQLASEQATVMLGGQLASIVQQLKMPLVAYLNGNLGAGKTTLTRGFVLGMGHNGNVKSPTYTLVEPYDLADWQVYHFDLYRLADPEELEFIGIRDYFNRHSCSFIEWPEKGSGLLPKADLVLNLRYAGTQREIELLAQSESGGSILLELQRMFAAKQ